MIAPQSNVRRKIRFGSSLNRQTRDNHFTWILDIPCWLLDISCWLLDILSLGWYDVANIQLIPRYGNSTAEPKRRRVAAVQSQALPDESQTQHSFKPYGTIKYRLLRFSLGHWIFRVGYWILNILPSGGRDFPGSPLSIGRLLLHKNTLPFALCLCVFVREYVPRKCPVTSAAAGKCLAPMIVRRPLAMRWLSGFVS